MVKRQLRNVIHDLDITNLHERQIRNINYISFDI